MTIKPCMYLCHISQWFYDHVLFSCIPYVCLRLNLQINDSHMFEPTNKYVCIGYHCFKIKQTMWCHVSQVILYKVLMWSQLFETKWIKDLDIRMKEGTLTHVPHKEVNIAFLHCIKHTRWQEKETLTSFDVFILLYHCIDDFIWSPYPWRFEASSINIFLISIFYVMLHLFELKKTNFLIFFFAFVALSSRFNHNVFSSCINVFLINLLFAFLNLS
jgi:hypothetical protein